MAVYTAYVAANTVGTTTTVFPTGGSPMISTSTFHIEYAPDYYMDVQLAPFALTGNVARIQVNDFLTNAPEWTWEPDGNVYPALPLLDILLGIVSATPGSSQDMWKYILALDDKFYGSNEGDTFCGWEGNDWFKLGKGKDYVYFADGQDKDTFKKFNWKKDTAVFDTDLVDKLKDVDKIKYKKKKTVLKFDDGDKFVMKGKKAPDNFSELKNCTDIQDWYV